jgi:hypothetical protein
MVEVASVKKWPEMSLDEVLVAKRLLIDGIMEKLVSMMHYVVGNGGMIPASHDLRLAPPKSDDPTGQTPMFDWLMSEQTGLEIMAIPIRARTTDGDPNIKPIFRGYQYGCCTIILPSWLLSGGSAKSMMYTRSWNMNVSLETSVHIVARDHVEVEEEWYTESRKGCQAHNDRIKEELLRVSLRRLEEFDAFLDMACVKLQADMTFAAIGDYGTTGLPVDVKDGSHSIPKEKVREEIHGTILVAQ